MIATDLVSSVLGFFELDESGLIRFSSSISKPIDNDPPLGQDFFEIAGFRNGPELRRRFRRFLDSREAAESFSFDCFLHDSVLHTQVTMTRAFTTEMFPPQGIVMLSIKESA
jgi:hypothetical protein